MSKNKTIAQQCRWLYAYTSTILLFHVIGIVKTYRTPMTTVPNLNPQVEHTTVIATMIVSLIIYTWLAIYLVTSKNLKRILLILKVLLAFKFIAILIVIPKLDYYNIGVETILVGCTAGMIWLLSRSKQKTSPGLPTSH